MRVFLMRWLNSEVDLESEIEYLYALVSNFTYRPNHSLRIYCPFQLSLLLLVTATCHHPQHHLQILERACLHNPLNEYIYGQLDTDILMEIYRTTAHPSIRAIVKQLVLQCLASSSDSHLWKVFFQTLTHSHVQGSLPALVNTVYTSLDILKSLLLGNDSPAIFINLIGNDSFLRINRILPSSSFSIKVRIRFNSLEMSSKVFMQMVFVSDVLTIAFSHNDPQQIVITNGPFQYSF